MPPWVEAYPAGLDWQMDVPSAPVWQLLEEAASTFPNRPFLEFLGKRMTYAEGLDMVNRLALGLQQLGLAKGQRVGLFLPNCPYFVIAYYAILKAGGVVVNLNPLYVERDIIHHVNDSDIELIFTLDLAKMYDKLVAVMDKTPLKRMVVCSLARALPFPKTIIFPLVRGKELCQWTPDTRHIAWEDLLAPKGSEPAPVPVEPHHDLAVLQYTGGTTGVSKGAMLTHGNVYANAVQSAVWFQGAELGRERMMGVLPLFHVFAMTVVMNMAIRLGAEICLLPKFEINGLMKALHKLRPTLLPAVPTIFTAINHHPELPRYNLSSIKLCISGGAPLPLEVKQQFEMLTGCRLVEGYGLSETSPVACCNPMQGKNKPGSIGLPLPRTWLSIRALNDATREVPPGERGEVCIKGPQVMSGYWNRPEETAAVMLPDGWLRTGDVGIMDSDGYFSIVDRIKDMIICGGYNVYPRNVEEMIHLHPAVAETVVLGVPDEYRGQTVKAYVKLKPGQSLTADDLSAFLKDKLSPIERPKLIEFRDGLPKTMIGKFSRKDLREENGQQGTT